MEPSIQIKKKKRISILDKDTVWLNHKYYKTVNPPTFSYSLKGYIKNPVANMVSVQRT